MATLEELSKEATTALKKNGMRLVTAESCTGGGVAFWITSIPDASTCFDRGFITYSDEAKINLIGVTPITLESFGAVSEQTVREMAEGALKNSSGDVSIAITGIAGPDGGTRDKPVGTVWIGVAGRNKATQATVDLFSGDRSQIREQAIAKAFSFLISYITA